MDVLETVTRRTVDLCVRLTRAGVPLVIVGGTARWLRGDDRVLPGDLDVVVDEEHLGPLLTALGDLGVRAPGPHRRTPFTVPTAWGPLDVFVKPIPPASATLVDGIRVWIADE